MFAYTHLLIQVFKIRENKEKKEWRLQTESYSYTNVHKDKLFKLVLLFWNQKQKTDFNLS